MAHRSGLGGCGGCRVARGWAIAVRVTFRVVAPALVLISPSSCSSESVDGNAPLVRDSAGVVIVENTGPAWTEDTLWRLSEEPLLVLGGSADDPDGQLWMVNGLARLSDGRIVVLNAGSGELRFFDASGKLVAKAGRLGGGPGEFQYPLSLDVLGQDTLVALDRMGDRLFFGSQGEFLREETMDPGKWQSFWRPRYGVSYAGVLPDHSLVAELVEQTTPGISYPEGLRRSVNGLAIVRADVSDTTHVAWILGLEQEVAFRLGDKSWPWTVVPPFAAYGSFSLGGNPIRIVVTDNAACEFRHHGLGGALERIVRWTCEREGIQAWEVEDWKEEQRSMSWPGENLPLWERAWANMTLPEKKRAYDRAFVDRESNTWVQEVAAIGASVLTFTVFDAEGRMLGPVEVPAGLSPTWRRVDVGSDYFLGVWLDEYEVETVRMYRLIKPEA